MGQAFISKPPQTISTNLKSFTSLSFTFHFISLLFHLHLHFISFPLYFSSFHFIHNTSYSILYSHISLPILSSSSIPFPPLCKFPRPSQCSPNFPRASSSSSSSSPSPFSPLGKHTHFHSPSICFYSLQNIASMSSICFSSYLACREVLLSIGLEWVVVENKI